MTLNKKYFQFVYKDKQNFTKAELIVFGIVENLRGRRGIRQEWDIVDDDIQEEILQKLLEITESELNVKSKNSLNHQLFEYVKRMPQYYKNACFMWGHSVFIDENNSHYVVTMCTDLELAGISQNDIRIPFNTDLNKEFDYSIPYIHFNR